MVLKYNIKFIKSRLKYLVTLFYLLVFTLLLNGQKTYSFGHQVNFKHYSNEDGFFSSSIRCLFQDSKGLIWIGSQDGLSVFNGHSFYNFSYKDGFDFYDIGALCEDNNGGIWIGSHRGIFVFKENKFIKLDTAESKSPKSICWSLYKDNDGSIWAGTQRGIYHFNPENLTEPFMKRYILSGSRGSNIIRMLKRKNNGKLLAGTEDGFYCYKPDTFYRASNGGGAFYTLIEFDDNKEWLSGFGMPIHQYRNEKQDSVIDLSTGVLSMTKDKQGNVWISTWEKAVYKYNGKDFVNYSAGEGLDYNSFWSSLTDKEGNIWFGSFGNGLYKYSGEVFTSINEKNNLYSNNVNSLAQDTSGKVWIASDNSISCYDPKLNSITNYTSYNNAPLSMIQALVISEKNEVLALRYGGNGYKIQNSNLTSEPWIAGFCGLRGENGEYYFGAEQTLQKINKNKTVENIAGQKKRLNTVIGIYRDKPGHFWLLNHFFGIVHFTGENEYLLSKKDGFTDAAATCVYSEKNGTLWMGTKGKGVYKCKLVNDSTIQILDSISSFNGLNSDIVNSIVIHDNNMLIGTAYGLGVLNMADYARGIKAIKTYNADEGCVNSNCTVEFIDKKGKAWIRTNKGVFVFDESVLVFNSEEPSTFIQNIQLFHEPVDWRSIGFKSDKNGLPDNLILPYDQNHLTFNFIGICNTAPSKVLYQYILVGSDKEWSPASFKNEAVYSNIGPGTYTFMVKSCNNDNIWNKSPTSFVFTITPPFWKRFWFYAFVFIVLIISIYVFIKFRERKLKEQNEMLELKINERTQQLKNALIEIEEKNKDITDSINYAKRIQEAILPEKELKYKLFPNSFILYQPRDIVSGDFYWFTESKGKKLIAAVDCTGHGVPGAFMSLIGSTILNELVNVQGITKPNEILNKLRDQVILSLKQADGNNKDGMDISLLCFDDKRNTIEFAGANNPLWIIRDGKCIEIKGDKQPVGYNTGEKKPFTNHLIAHLPGDSLYVFTDGYADQFGGDKGKKYKNSHLKEFIISIQTVSELEQEEKLRNELTFWKGNLEQVDDVCIIGIRL